jgi:cytochrome c553
VLISTALLTVSLFQAPAATNTCVSCHLEIGDELAEPVEKFKSDVHSKRGLSCADCHGGDPKEIDPERSMDPRKGFVGSPAPRQIPAFCGKCHSNAETMKRFNPRLRVDQEAEFATSVHGMRIAKGETKAATCVSCHGNHGILSVTDPNAPVFPTHVAETCGRCHGDAALMKDYPIPTNQLSNYLKSAHAEALLKNQDLFAPTCNDCHGNHGAAPPGVSSIANVCGTCHARQADLFAKSPHADAFDALGLAQCIECHGNHDILQPNDDWVGVTSQSTCVKCHEMGEPGYEAARTLNENLAMLTGELRNAEGILDRAATAGMEVSRAKFELNDARDSVINARVLVHGFSANAMDSALTPGLEIARRSHEAGEQALRDLDFRRKGLVVSLIVIALTITSLYLKIREIDNRP